MKSKQLTDIGRLIGLTSIIAAGLLFVAVQPAIAIDEVIQKGAETSPKGTVSKVEKTGVTVSRKIGKAIVVPANEIISIRWDGEPPKLNLARSDEQGGRLKKALDGYLEVQKATGSAKDNLKADIEFLIARTSGKIALTDPIKIDDAIAKLEAFQKSHSDSFHHFEAAGFLGRVYLAKKDYAKAKAAFADLATAPWNEFKMAAQSANARILLLQGDPAGAIKAFNSVIASKATSPLEESRRYEAMLGKATCLIQQQSYDESLKSLSAVVSGASGDDSRLQAEAYLRQGDCLQALGRTKEAVLAYLHIDVLFAKEKALHAESLYQLSRLWPAVGQADRGADARAILEKAYPNSEWAKKLASSGGTGGN